jgi:hypothetical protein
MTLEQAVLDWARARQAILDVEGAGWDQAAKARDDRYAPLWGALGAAEHILMTKARGIDGW